MTFGSICSGIEAASVAWHPLGWRAAFVSEIDPFASAVLSHRFPGVPNLGDFTSIRTAPEPIDVLVGGTPCQSFSVAGLRGGMADDRGNLALEFLELADRLRPTWVVWENVPGVLSSNKGRDFGSFLGGLVEFGYGFAYRVLDAQYVRIDGFGRAVPQRRRRVFVVGCLGDWRRAAAVLFERESLSGNPPPRREAGADVACALTRGLGSGGPDDTKAQANHLVAHTLRADGFDASEDGTGRGTPIIPIDLRQASRGEKFTNNRATGSGGPTGIGVGNPGDPAYTVSERGQAIAFQERGRDGGRNLEWQEGVSYALRAIDGGGCGDWFRIAHRWAVRRLTPLECERLQGFPDGWTDVPYRGKSAADGPRYKAVGNSMAVNAMRWIGRRIEAVSNINQ